MDWCQTFTEKKHIFIKKILLSVKFALQQKLFLRINFLYINFIFIFNLLLLSPLPFLLASNFLNFILCFSRNIDLFFCRFCVFKILKFYFIYNFIYSIYFLFFSNKLFFFNSLFLLLPLLHLTLTSVNKLFSLFCYFY